MLSIIHGIHDGADRDTSMCNQHVLTTGGILNLCELMEYESLLEVVKVVDVCAIHPAARGNIYVHTV